MNQADHPEILPRVPPFTATGDLSKGNGPQKLQCSVPRSSLPSATAFLLLYFMIKANSCQACWHTPEVPALRRLTWDYHVLEANLGFKETLPPRETHPTICGCCKTLSFPLLSKRKAAGCTQLGACLFPKDENKPLLGVPLAPVKTDVCS